MSFLFLVKGIGSKKKLNSKIQLCAGHKIIEKKLKAYEYTGTLKDTKFQEITKPINFAGRIKQKVK